MNTKLTEQATAEVQKMIAEGEAVELPEGATIAEAVERQRGNLPAMTPEDEAAAILALVKVDTAATDQLAAALLMNRAERTEGK